MSQITTVPLLILIGFHVIDLVIPAMSQTLAGHVPGFRSQSPSSFKFELGVRLQKSLSAVSPRESLIPDVHVGVLDTLRDGWAMLEMIPMLII